MTPPISATISGSGQPARSSGVGVRASTFFHHSWRGRVRLAALVCALGAAVDGGAAFIASRLTWNYTSSLPRGLYWLRPGRAVTRGALVDLPIPSRARALIINHYLPERFRLLKRVVALQGDIVCFADGHYRVNGTAISTIARTDALGRSLPEFRFCGEVPPGMAFVATPFPSSLDSRYFGPVPVGTLTVARPLWTS